MDAMEKTNSGKVRGCIRSTKSPWVVHRRTKKGLVTSLRYPTERERDNNRERERKRRQIAKRIYAGLRVHGNYRLPKYADNNDLLIALCEEAGWNVEEDGTICRKIITSTMRSRGSYLDMVLLLLLVLLIVAALIYAVQLLHQRLEDKLKSSWEDILLI